MGNSQYRRQHYITYHDGYKYSLPSVTGFIRQSGDYYLFPPPEISSGQGSERVNASRCYRYQLPYYLSPMIQWWHGGAAIGCWTCDWQVAGSISSQSAFM